jgi:hypothetical protein
VADRGSSALDTEFDTFTKARQRVRCTTCKLDPEVRAWAEAKVRGGGSMQAVVEFLQAQGYSVSTGSAFKNHMTNHVT